MADALILNYNDAETTKECVQNLKKCLNIDNILVIDNCSSDNSFEVLSLLASEKIRVVRTKQNGGYGAGNNYGIRYLYENCKSKYILLCNPDTIISDDCIAKLENFLDEHNEYAIVAPFMLNSKGERQFNTAFRIPSLGEYILSLGIIINKLRKSFYYNDIEYIKDEFLEVGAVSGSLFMMNTDLMLQYGMYDESIFLYCEEITLGLKLRDHNIKTALLPKESFIHNHSVSINKALKSEVKKQRQLMTSKLYVIKHHFKANCIQNFVAYIISRISIAETMCLTILRGENCEK